MKWLNFQKCAIQQEDYQQEHTKTQMSQFVVRLRIMLNIILNYHPNFLDNIKISSADTVFFQS